MNTATKILAAGALAIALNACSSQKKQAGVEDERPVSQQGRTQGGPAGAQSQGRPQGGAPNFAQLLAEMDANKDGKLAKSEVKGPLLNDFAKIDTDEDGFLSEKEIANAPRPQRGGGRE
ncbi:hypothetical protein [Algoriphagus jejuensis]